MTSPDSKLSSNGGGLFQSSQKSQTTTYSLADQKPSGDDAANQASKEIKKCLGMLDRLPNKPMFDGSKAVGDAVKETIKEGALNSLNIEIDNPGASLGLGTTSSNNDCEG